MRKDSPSKTAIVVAKSQALIASIPRLSGMLDPEAIEFTREALRVSGQGNFLRAIRYSAFRRMMARCENFKIPGLALHQVLRKKMIEKKVIAALEGGVKEVIQVGAGLDSLCFRLHRKWPHTKFVEIDHPATQEIKNEVVQSIGSLKSNFEMISHDLSQSLQLGAGKLRESSHSRLIIAEGLFMYFSKDEIRNLLKHWHQQFGDQSRLLFTFLTSNGFRSQTPLVNLWLRAVGEPFRWWSDHSGVKKIAAQNGWEPINFQATWKCGEFLKWTGNRTIAKGEWLVEAKPLPVF